MYEQAYDTDWETLDQEAVIDRAYALGVAASMGREYPEERERLREQVDTAYGKSVVDLAFEEGRTEAMEADGDPEADGEAVWAELVEGGTAAVDPEGLPTGGRDGVPEALERGDLLDWMDVDSTDRVSRPEFLDRD